MFICSHCDAQFPKWSGRCLECQQWGTVKEEEPAPTSSLRASKSNTAKQAKAKSVTPLSSLAPQNEHERLLIKNTEMARVFGGGLVAGSLTLLSGEPGIGKSTLVAQLAGEIASEKTPILYVSGEESGTQLKARFERLHLPLSHLSFLEMIALEELVATIEKESPALVIIDSVQTLFSQDLEAQGGSPTMVRYATSVLLELAKRTNISLLLVGQVTKDGTVAGPKTLEHLVDTVLTLTGDPSQELRFLEATKNRFGATDEIGVFEMTSEGLSAIENPSARFLAQRANVPGSVIATLKEGSRVFLVEVQALVEKSSYGTPVRRASGMDQNRLQMLVAILSKRAGLHLGDSDIYINVVGGMQFKEPSADLAVCAAIMHAATNATESAPTVYIGEVGLGGEVRSVLALDKRIAEAKRIGVDISVTPKTIKNVRDLRS